MTTHSELEYFGQEAMPARHMNEMTRGITSAICDGRRPTFVGFTWYLPQQELKRQVLALLLELEREVA